MKWPLHIVFDGPPGHESGRFVEVEDDTGSSVNAGTWADNSVSGFHDLVIPAPRAWVLMGNDFPAAVLTDEATARGLVEALTARDKTEAARDRRRRIYWAVHDFTMDGKPEFARELG